MNNSPTTFLGRLARSESPGKHSILVERPKEGESPISPEYGSYVRVKTPTLDLIGIISSVQAVDTTKGHYDDWFSSHPDLANVFDQEITEKPTLATVHIIGTFNGKPTHTFTGLHPALGSETYVMDDEDIRVFHEIDGAPRVAYYQRIVDHPEISKDILTLVLGRLRAALPECADMIDVLEQEATMARYIR